MGRGTDAVGTIVETAFLLVHEVLLRRVVGGSEMAEHAADSESALPLQLTDKFVYLMRLETKAVHT